MELSQDGFLDGRIQAWQPVNGYRAAGDPVFLAAACPAKPGDHVLDLGCGVGVASLCLIARVGRLRVVGVEIQPDYAKLARLNSAQGPDGFDVVEADLANLPAQLRHESFDQVIANPPFFLGGTQAPEAGRATARHEDTPLKDWIDTAHRRLKPKGWVTLILPADRLPELMRLLDGPFGDITVLPLVARDGRDARRVIVKARKSGRGAFRLCAPLVLHKGSQHEADGDDFSDEARQILRDGAALDLG